jgi:hypothetical protein
MAAAKTNTSGKTVETGVEAAPAEVEASTVTAAPAEAAAKIVSETEKQQAGKKAGTKAAEKSSATEKGSVAKKPTADEKKDAAVKGTKTEKKGKDVDAKKAPAEVKDLKAEIHVQYSDKDLDQEGLLKSAKDVWKYDLKRNEDDLTDIKLYVKPLENKVYYVFNDVETGDFDI